ncbi:hypothetical protein P3342_009110 [Pyrenophora teres f. teres]|uniref:Uncharacterized protein n=2 Tax=Pyrenophora teres f. teres TaxID=97479 RepID=E3S190_PYRTT|nr:hypothetical protein PTT_15952 [Pyrenophora teres f. teres 0-1]KAE8826585.1 hypothetical protein HRS9122_10087 [Pyrenophora teres f. teres]KAE8826588.1 hypothetical protein HRS9122_10090 [Pyrenophora teres f. teres]KAE8828540.1 hypothetical protein HRS9139_07759 [Pyrenophora teres f. teres]KAE8828543.1 hypothetical protein HRS9139_07762 [Pyrenophora teres f. teres]
MRFFNFVTAVSVGFATAGPLLSEQHSDSALGLSPGKDDPARLPIAPSQVVGKRDPEPVTVGVAGRGTDIPSSRVIDIKQRKTGDIGSAKDDPMGLLVPLRPAALKREPEPTTIAVPIPVITEAGTPQPTIIGKRKIGDVDLAKKGSVVLPVSLIQPGLLKRDPEPTIVAVPIPATTRGAGPNPTQV